MASDKLSLLPIGIIHTPFHQASGTPIQPRFAKGVLGTVEVFDDFAAGLKDLEGFDRVWLLYWFDRAADVKLLASTYLDNHPHGVFATRAPSRPNPIGLSCVKLVGVDGNVLRVDEIDILDGTPLLDIKPYSSHFDSFAGAKNGWMDAVWSKIEGQPVVADDRFFRKKD
jgi:tRNA (adenine37-N6)-methyltransferase